MVDRKRPSRPAAKPAANVAVPSAESPSDKVKDNGWPSYVIRKVEAHEKVTAEQTHLLTFDKNGRTYRYSLNRMHSPPECRKIIDSA